MNTLSTHKDIYRATHCSFIIKRNENAVHLLWNWMKLLAKPHRSEYTRTKITTKNCTHWNSIASKVGFNDTIRKEKNKKRREEKKRDSSLTKKSALHNNNENSNKYTLTHRERSEQQNRLKRTQRRHLCAWIWIFVSVRVSICRNYKKTHSQRQRARIS